MRPAREVLSHLRAEVQVPRRRVRDRAAGRRLVPPPREFLQPSVEHSYAQHDGRELAKLRADLRRRLGQEPRRLVLWKHRLESRERFLPSHLVVDPQSALHPPFDAHVPEEDVFPHMLHEVSLLALRHAGEGRGDGEDLALVRGGTFLTVAAIRGDRGGHRRADLVRGDLHGHRVHREPGPGRDDALGGRLRERVVPRHALVSERRAVVRGEDGIELDARLAASAHDVHRRLTRPVVHRRVPCAPIA